MWIKTHRYKALFEIILSKKLVTTKAVDSNCVSSDFYNMYSLNIDRFVIKGYLRPVSLHDSGSGLRLNDSPDIEL